VVTTLDSLHGSSPGRSTSGARALGTGARACLALACLCLVPARLAAQETGDTKPSAAVAAATGQATAKALSASPDAAAAHNYETSPSPLNPKPEELPPSASPVQAASQLDALLSRVADLRSRIAALTSSLFSSRLRVEVRSEGEDVAIKSLSVSLDGGLVYTAPAQTFFEQPEVVYEHAVAPGPHVVGIEVERYARKDQKFSTWQASRFVVVVPDKQLLWTRLEISDDSSMAEDFPEDREGRYELRVRLQAEVTE
jgi:hypothetical protein